MLDYFRGLKYYKYNKLVVLGNGTLRRIVNGDSNLEIRKKLAYRELVFFQLRVSDWKGYSYICSRIFGWKNVSLFSIGATRKAEKGEKQFGIELFYGLINKSIQW